MSAALAITGATGKLGGRVSGLLDEAGIDHVAIARDPQRLPQLPHLRPAGPAAYDDPTFANALAGADTLLLVSASLSGRRLAEHTAAIESAREAGVRRIVYVSLLGSAPDATYVNARDHWQTEQVLADSGLRWTVVRPSFYTDTLARLLDEDGVVRGPAPTGRVSLVGHLDIAEVLVGLLTDPTDEYDGAVLPVTGPDALRLDEACDFEPVTVPEARRRRSVAGEPPHLAEGWVSWFLAIERGEVAEVADTVRVITGHEARGVDVTRVGTAPPWTPRSD